MLSRAEAQAGARDPKAFIPAKVDAAEVFWQRLSWDQTAEGRDERRAGLNLLADAPHTLVNRSGKAIRAVGVFGVGHNDVPIWYLEHELGLI